jgi:hypothetical protein
MGRLKLSQVSQWCLSQPVPRVQILRVLLVPRGDQALGGSLTPLAEEPKQCATLLLNLEVGQIDYQISGTLVFQCLTPEASVSGGIV